MVGGSGCISVVTYYPCSWCISQWGWWLFWWPFTNFTPCARHCAKLQEHKGKYTAALSFCLVWAGRHTITEMDWGAQWQCVQGTLELARGRTAETRSPSVEPGPLRSDAATAMWESPSEVTPFILDASWEVGLRPSDFWRWWNHGFVGGDSRTDCHPLMAHEHGPSLEEGFPDVHPERCKKCFRSGLSQLRRKCQRRDIL